jgi:hypothetical protein
MGTDKILAPKFAEAAERKVGELRASAMIRAIQGDDSFEGGGIC